MAPEEEGEAYALFGGENFRLDVLSDEADWSMAIYVQGAGQTISYPFPVTLTPEAWIHLVFTWDATHVGPTRLSPTQPSQMAREAI